MTTIGGVAGDQLKTIIERVENLEQEKEGIAVDIREVFAEAKANGFDVKTLRQILKLRKKDQSEIDEEEHMLDLYKRVLGMLPELDEQEDEAEDAA